MNVNRCSSCDAPSNGAYRCQRCTAVVEQDPAERFGPAAPVGRVRSPYNPMLFPWSGLTTLLVWARPRNAVARGLIGGFRVVMLVYVAIIIGVCLVVLWR
jgi:hypothetical protein